jgi:hypothetical protein
MIKLFQEIVIKPREEIYEQRNFSDGVVIVPHFSFISIILVKN